MVREFYTLCRTPYIEVHHTPAKRSMRNAGMNLKVWELAGPSVAMNKLDHEKTASHGRLGNMSKVYTDIQTQLILSGQFRSAVEMDQIDLRRKFGGKYEIGIQQMDIYLGVLERLACPPPSCDFILYILHGLQTM